MTLEERLQKQQEELKQVNQRIINLETDLLNAKNQSYFLWGTIGMLQGLIEEEKKNEQKEQKEEEKDGAGS